MGFVAKLLGLMLAKVVAPPTPATAQCCGESGSGDRIVEDGHDVAAMKIASFVGLVRAGLELAAPPAIDNKNVPPPTPPPRLPLAKLAPAKECGW